MIIEVDMRNIYAAAQIHSQSWQKSHKDFCTPEFIEMHGVEHQREYLLSEIRDGKKIYMLIEKTPIGIVSVKEDLIENLYVLPEEQGKGYGRKLLEFAISKCIEEPCLWILDNNIVAYNLYSKYGFYKTGNKNSLSPTISEIEMRKENILLGDVTDENA